MNSISKFALAASAAALFSSTVIAPVFAGETDAADTVKCQGINACKGQAQCKSAANSCKGHNACKGQGWMPTASEQECTDQGGTVVK